MGGADLRNPSVANAQVMGTVEVAARIEHVGAADQQLGGLGVVVEQLHATAASLGAPTSSS